MPGTPPIWRRSEIRIVVQAMRDAGGLDLETALRALTAPFPRPQLLLDLGADVRINDPAVAEALLRIVQQAFTNAARHADADQHSVRIARSGDDLTLAIVAINGWNRMAVALRKEAGSYQRA